MPGSLVFATGARLSEHPGSFEEELREDTRVMAMNRASERRSSSRRSEKPALANILLVEDSAAEALLVRKAIEHAVIGVPVTVRLSGEAALETLRGGDGTPPLERPYIVLLDLEMPGMGGLAFLDALRADPRLRAATVFVLTGSEHGGVREQAYRRHVAGFLHKANPGQELLDMLDLLERFSSVVRLPA